MKKKTVTQNKPKSKARAKALAGKPKLAKTASIAKKKTGKKVAGKKKVVKKKVVKKQTPAPVDQNKENETPVESEYLILSSSDIEKAFGITRQAFALWRKSTKFPSSAKLKYGKYNFNKVLEFYIEREVGNKALTARKQLADTIKAEEDAALKTMHRQEEMGELERLDKVREDLVLVFAEIKSNIDKLQIILPPKLEGKHLHQRGLIIKSLTDPMLHRCADGLENIGKPKPVKKVKKVKKK